MVRSSPYLEIIAGPMYCGKTEELIRQVRRAVIGKKKVQVFKHAIDTRYGKRKSLHSHNGVSFSCQTVKSVKEIIKKIHQNTEIVAIDEAQWFGNELVDAVKKLLDNGKKILIAGLSMTYDRQPFAPLPVLMAMADKVTKLSAVCTICGEEAVFHKRMKNDKAVDPLQADPSLVGSNIYEARCRKCYSKK